MEQSLKKNEIYDAVIDGYTAEGMGVARINGMAVFIPFSARGDSLRVKIVKVGRSFAYGRIEEVLSPSPYRVTPECPAFGKCGGCTFLHLGYEEELRLKGQRVTDALRRIGGFDIEVGPAEPSDRRGYRNKAQFLPCRGENGTEFGFYRARSHQVVSCGGRCMIQGAASNELARAVCRWMDELDVRPYDEESRSGLVRHIYVREGAGGCLLCIVVNGKSLPGLPRLVQLACEARGDLKGVVLNINTEHTNRIMGDKCVTLWGEGELRDELMGLEFRLSPMSFYQVNHPQAERLYQAALDAAGLTESDTALDLYCGAGTITLLLARRCGRAIGSEIVPQAVENARESAERNGIGNVEFILGDAGQAADKLAQSGLHPDVIVTDPPRKGMDGLAADAICRMGPKKVVYISCDPASLARDCARLAKGGYTVASARAFDMFPGTSNVETVCLLSKLQSKEHIEIEVAMDEMDLTSAESKATYEEIREYVFEHTGLKVSHLYIAQVKQKCGIIERENYNKPKSEDAKQPQCPPEKEKAITEAFNYFGML